MNSYEVKRIAQLVIQSLLDQNLIEITGRNSEKIINNSPAKEDSGGNFSTGTSSTIKPDINQVLTAEKVKSCAGRNAEKIIVPVSTIVTGLAEEEAKKLGLVIVQQ